MILAIDTSTATVGLALYDGNKIHGEVIWITQNYHTTELAPAISDLLERCGIKTNQLTGIAVALGPGSFTSLRIGLAAAKGLTFGLDIPIFGIPSLDILAASQPPREQPMIALLQAGRTRLAAAEYHYIEDQWKRVDEIQVFTAAEISDRIKKSTYICGEMSSEDRNTLSRKWKNVILADPVQSQRRPSFLAQLAWERMQNQDNDQVDSLAPIYIHFNQPIKKS